jgi:hypothetical protein
MACDPRSQARVTPEPLFRKMWREITVSFEICFRSDSRQERLDF